ncbi:MAG: hypothetical protein K0R34_1567 [Herbinix sp.]|jgi:hypothetical protein|nr:hypothetical protein [Herbinix sp.]
MGKYEMGAQMPIGLGLALEQGKAMEYFCSLSEEEQHRIIDQTHRMQTTTEIADFVQTIITRKNGLV